MNRRLFLRVTAPAIAVGLILFAACLASMVYINRLQSDLATVVSDSVASLQASKELEIRVRQLRFHTLLYLINPKTDPNDPATDRLKQIEEDERGFQSALEAAAAATQDQTESQCVEEIREGFRRYREEQALLRHEPPKARTGPELTQVADTHPINYVYEPCRKLARITKAKMEGIAGDSRAVSRQGTFALLVLGLAGPVGGLVAGYGVARGLRQSILRLSVRVQDMAQRLEQDVGSLQVAADGDLHGLDEQMKHIVGRLEEVAERVQQQQRELLRTEQLAAAGQLAAGVAHEVRNPLTGIKMLVDAALRPGNPRPLDAEDLRVIHGELVRVEQTVQGFLDVTRLPAPKPERCDLREVMRRASDLVRGRAMEKRVAVGVAAPDQPVMAEVDRGQMSTVLVNLLLNALDAVPEGGRVEVRVEPPESGAVRMSVSDNGPGIAEEVLGRLFTPFVTTKRTGTGLGLSLCARILEEHGGAVVGANRPTGGARFDITLPVRE